MKRRNDFDIVKALWLRREKRRRKWKLKEIEGTPPLIYKSIEGTLKNYRIYGNTENGESVGDKTENLLDASLGFNSNSTNSLIYGNHSIRVVPGKIYSTVCSFSPYLYSRLTFFNQNGRIELEGAWANTGWCTYTAPENAIYAKANCRNHRYGYITDEEKESFSKIMVVSGSTIPENFIPYGYRVPVTVTNGTDTQTTNLYLPEQIKMVGDEAEYIDYEEQKQHFADGTSVDVALPALPTLPGTNILSVGTDVQPTKVMIKGRVTA